MKYLPLVLLFLASTSIADEMPKTPLLGTYSAFTEADWTVAFELKAAGKARVTTEYNYEYDEKGKRIEREKNVAGTWEFQSPNLILSYEGYKDKFVQSPDCYEKKPCFKYNASVEKKSAKSPLDVKFEFINWGKGLR